MDSVRTAARSFEAALPSAQRKLLGQFFTGLPLGKLLAHLALSPDTRTILDPMAGHGDLLDASWEAAEERGITLDRLDGIEIDAPIAAHCQHRLAQIVGEHETPRYHILTSSAFDRAAQRFLLKDGYDLLITNPPYVRYQTRNAGASKGEQFRVELEAIADSRLSGADKSVWQALIEGYSGLADLSIPSWLLSGLLVRPGGRLALVVPATWRSRDYADVIRYLMLRCFTLDYVVEDTQPGWFSNVLVRTHLIFARRLTTEEVAIPLRDRTGFPTVQWLQVSPDAANYGSLVGAAFGEEQPEAALAAWLHGNSEDWHRGIERHSFNLQQEWAILESRIRSKRWFRRLEGPGTGLPLFAMWHPSPDPSLPNALQGIIPDEALGSLCMLKEAGIHVGQGLRTGCNQFFYVTVCGQDDDGMVRVRASSLFDNREFCVPAGALLPVLRRQSEIHIMQTGQLPPGRVLDLRGWVLQEDAQIVMTAAPVYNRSGEAMPSIMPSELSTFVRLAGQTSQEGNTNVKRIPDLSAVRTNIRTPRNGDTTPRFWYMLPDFAPRHLPAVFVPRVNHSRPFAEANLDPPILVDANFSTFWSSEETWTRFALKAMLNSTWCFALAEALGTPLGGGALKLEASHFRQMPIPKLSATARAELDAAGRELTTNATSAQSRVDVIMLRAVMGEKTEESRLIQLVGIIAARAEKLCRERQRV